MTPVQIPKHVDAPMQMAFWEMDELAPMLGMFVVGIMTNTLTIMLVFMLFATKIYQRYKDNSRRGALMAFLHWNGLYDFGGQLKNGLARLHLG